MRALRSGAIGGFGLAMALGFTLHPSLGSAQTSPADTSRAEALVRWQSPAAFRAFDHPNDEGHGISFHWQLSPDDAHLRSYEIQMSRSPAAPDSAWVTIGNAPRGSTSFAYEQDEAMLQGKPNPLYVPRGVPLDFRIRSVGPDENVSRYSEIVQASAHGNWFHTGKVNVLIATILLAGGTVYFIRVARSGKTLFIRPIPGISAVDEAIGRATEMGRPILFVLGTGTAGDIATIAGYTVLARVARKTAEYQTPILVPVNDPVMMAMAQETVSQAYVQAGRPDLYRPESVFYISAMQFPYVAAVNGLMMREKTATNFYMGVFAAESLLLAEAGSMAGSIQISGTDQVSQIPFFVAATDYTLIGEELYAASAYLSQEPVLMGPLKAQDWMKILILAILVVGVLVWTLFGSDVIARVFVHAA